jgi:hypothetical protein
MFFIFPGKFAEKDPPTLCSKQQKARGLHSMSALFRKVHTTRRFQEALQGYSQESTRTTLVSTRQDLEKQEEAFKINHTLLGGLSIHSTWGTLQGREKI